MLGVGYFEFINRLQQEVEIRHYIIGIAKSFIFAIVIAIVGCFQGYQAHLNADSVGEHTTKSVVQAIFLIIIVDATFSVMFNWQNEYA